LASHKPEEAPNPPGASHRVTSEPLKKEKPVKNLSVPVVSVFQLISQSSLKPLVRPVTGAQQTHEYSVVKLAVQLTL